MNDGRYIEGIEAASLIRANYTDGSRFNFNRRSRSPRGLRRTREIDFFSWKYFFFTKLSISLSPK